MGEAIPYPRTVVAFLLVNQFGERFTFYGIRTILSLYISEELRFSEHATTIIYHFFAMLVFGFPVIGAIIADSCLGKFRTIFYLSLVYIFGDVVLTLSSVGYPQLPPIEFAIIGLVLIAVGTGGIKPCVAAFGGDQFVLPQQEKEREGYFHLFYFSINVGSLLSMFSIPLLRKHVHCFGKQSCYALGFGVCSAVMTCAVLVFVMGKPFYKMSEPQGNMILKMCKCIGTAVNQKCKSKGVKKDHWLDFAADIHGQTLVNEIKIVLKVLYLYLPLPLFWALFEQMATGWTFQARRMNGEVGNYFTILPDQMQICNPIMVLMLIPLINYCLYPVCNTLGFLNTPLQKIATGGFLTALAFLLTALLEIAVENTLPILPEPGHGQIRIFNILPCKIEVTSPSLNGGETFDIKGLEFFVDQNLTIKEKAEYNYTFKAECSTIADGKMTVLERKAVSCFFIKKNDQPQCIEDNVDKSITGNPVIRTMVNLNEIYDKAISIELEAVDYGKGYSWDSSNTNLTEVNPNKYKLKLDVASSTKHQFQLGGVYTVGIIAMKKGEFKVQSMEVTPANKIHILWMIPQYLVISLGECMLAITGIEFSYSQAPISMKSVLQAAWLLTSSFGQLFVVIISAIQKFDKISSMFFLYAALMTVDMVLFTIMTLSYTYITEVQE